MHLSPQTLLALTSLIHDWIGLVIGPDKTYLIRHRLEPVIREHSLEGFDDLLARVKGTNRTRLRDAVIDAITTKETSFFRDPWFFEVIGRQILPERISHHHAAGRGRRRLRIWSAGSSTGQEAYSLAMLVRELIDASDNRLGEDHFSIVASDISGAAVESARQGKYTRAEVDRGVSAPRLANHFQHRGDHWIVKEPIKRLVDFRKVNLLDLPSDLASFDLILCRNVLIYFDAETQKQVCQSLAQALYDGGTMALGSAESLYGKVKRLNSVKFGRAVVYQKNA